MDSQSIFNAYINMATAETTKRAKLNEHTERVVNLCEEFADDLGVNVNERKLLIDAAWLHDIAKFDDKINHNTKICVETAINSVKTDSDGPINNAIYDIIEAHKGKFEPCKQYQLEAAILRICDKLDKFSKGKVGETAVERKEREIEALDKCKKSIKKIRKRIPDLPVEFLDTYNALLNERNK